MTTQISELTNSDLSTRYAWSGHRTFRLNLVLSSEGSLSGTDGTSVSLTNTQDRRLLRVIRNDAHVVIIGSESVRREGWFLPPQGRLFVLSGSGDVPRETCPDPTRVVILPTVNSLLHHLSPTDLNILCEGGLLTAEAIAQQIGFDEIALSFSSSEKVREIPVELTQNLPYVLTSELQDAEHTMTFGLWRRAT